MCTATPLCGTIASIDKYSTTENLMKLNELAPTDEMDAATEADLEWEAVLRMHAASSAMPRLVRL